MSYSPTLDDFNEAEKISYSNKSNGSSLLDKAGDIADIFNKGVESSRLPDLSLGFLQGASHGAESLANIPLSALSSISGKDLKVPYTDLQKYSAQDPESRSAFFAGEIPGELLPFGGASKISEKLFSYFMNPSVSRKIISGSLSGASTTGSDDERTRILGAVGGAVIPAINELRPSSIASKVLENKKNLQDIFEKRYNDFFDLLKNKGIHEENLRLPSILNNKNSVENINDIFTNNRSFQNALNRFKDNPTFENAHNAQSTLGKLSNRLYNQSKTAQRTGNTLSGEENIRMNNANDLRDRIRGSMQQFLVDKGENNLLNQYSQITKDYREKLSPYLNPEISKFEQGKSRAKELVNALIRNEKFMSPKGAYNDVPGIGIRGLMHRSGAEEILKKILIGASLGSGASLAYHFGMPYVGSLIKNATS